MKAKEISFESKVIAEVPVRLDGEKVLLKIRRPGTALNSRYAEFEEFLEDEGDRITDLENEAAPLLKKRKPRNEDLARLQELDREATAFHGEAVRKGLAVIGALMADAEAFERLQKLHDWTLDELTELLQHLVTEANRVANHGNNAKKKTATGRRSRTYSR